MALPRRKTALWQKRGVVKPQASTQENINRLIEFRQAAHAHVFRARRDAPFETLDALLGGGVFASFAHWSRKGRFDRPNCLKFDGRGAFLWPCQNRQG